jgi:cation:H+ antiporter
MFIGSLLLAGATSLPELLTTLSSISEGEPNLAAGNIFGSCMFNMALLATIDMAFWRARVLRRVALRHALTAGLAILILAMAAFFILADIELRLAWIGLDSLLIVAVYVVGMWLLQRESPRLPEPEELSGAEGLMPLPRALLGFGVAAVLLTIITPVLVRSSIVIAEITGLGTGFVGTTLVGVATSLPEVVTCIAAVRLGAFDLAVGNLFGSNVFNVLVLGVTDIFYASGRFMGAIDPDFALAALLGLIMTAVALINNLARVERRILRLEVDALILVILYLGGLYFLYVRGIAG